MTGEYAPKHSYADAIRKRIWYKRFLEYTIKLKNLGCTHKQIEAATYAMYDMLNGHRAFRSRSLAESARESMQLACIDVKKQRRIHET